MTSKSDKSYSIGDLISNEHPIVHVVDFNNKSLKCDNCLKYDKFLKRCSKCAKMYYCDRECQKSDWHSHKNECQIYAQYYDQCLNDFLVRLVMRLWLLIKADNSLLTKKFKLINGYSRCLNDLKSHENEIKSDRNRMKQFEEICVNFTTFGIEYSTDELFRLYGQLLINVYSIVIHEKTYENIKSGFGLFVGASVFDHSCAPNACIVFNGLNLQIRAIKPIAKDEEIFLHYIALDVIKTERKAKLKAQYYFDCNCNKCQSEEDDKVDYQKFKSLQNQLQQNINAEECAGKETSLLIEELLSISQQIYGAVHPELAAIMMIVMQYRLISPEPDCGPQVMSQFIEKTGQVIKLSFGSDHKFYKMYKMFDSIKNMKMK